MDTQGHNINIDIDEFEHAISVLRFAKSTREAARTDTSAAERIAEMAQRMRHSGEKKRSPLLVGIAEALEDWLIWWGTARN